MLTLQPINEENYLDAIKLKVHPDQQNFVASPTGILARAYIYRNSRAIVWGIYMDQQLVGLILIYDLDEEPACYHLCEFMIDYREQGKGYGEQALTMLLSKCGKERKYPRVELCVKKDNKAAIHVYEKAGFRDSGYCDPQTPDSLSMVYDLPLEIRYRNIILRNRRESDIEDEIRWNTVETQWALWDAPWEMEEELSRFDANAYRLEELERLRKPKEEPRWNFELDTEDGTHIGSVSSYLIDESWEWIRLRDVKPDQEVFRTLGIEINESNFWSRGLGTQALTAFIQYYLDRGIRDLCLQTWSGNVRMIRCARKLGFVVCSLKKGFRKVRDGIYDGLTFRLDLKAFSKFLQENS